MSRSNPSTDAVNPSTRWFEWDGEKGEIRHYDKHEKKNIVSKLPFTFIVLDQLATIKGWSDETDSGIYSNEVRDTRAQPFIVKAFKSKRPIATGIYQQIKDKVAAAGGKFVTNIYIAYKDGDELKIGSLQFKGAALNAWVDFAKANRGALLAKACRLTGMTEGKKGKIVFQTPIFAIHEISTETNEAAVELDRQLQEYLTTYFQRRSTEQAETHHEPADGDGEEEEQEEGATPSGRRHLPPEEDMESESDIPF